MPSELTGEDPSVGIEVGTSLAVLDTGVSDGLTEDTAVDEGRSDSIRDEITSDGLGVAERFREALSWPCVDSAEGLSSCLRTAAWGAAPANCSHRIKARLRTR